MKVFLVEHVHVLDEDEDEEDTKTIGVYSTQQRAEEAVKRASQLEGFRDHVEGFLISTMTMDQDYWEEGFITIHHDR